jgi:hypothetical protein
MKAAILLRHVPEDVRREFKSWCARRGTTMTAELIRYMATAPKTPKGKD